MRMNVRNISRELWASITSDQELENFQQQCLRTLFH